MLKLLLIYGSVGAMGQSAEEQDVEALKGEAAVVGFHLKPRSKH